jgi:hypothetical protein
VDGRPQALSDTLEIRLPERAQFVQYKKIAVPRRSASIGSNAPAHLRLRGYNEWAGFVDLVRHASIE